MNNKNTSSDALIKRFSKWVMLIDTVWSAIAATFFALMANAIVVGAAGVCKPDYWISVSAWLFAFIVAFLIGGIILIALSVVILRAVPAERTS
jgi:hypothetical protein